MTNVFVAAQVSVSIVLLFGGILLLRTFLNLTSTAPGFDPDGVVTIRASIPPIPHGEPRRSWPSRIGCATPRGSLPGVTAAAHAMFIPFTAGAWGDGYRRAGNGRAAPRGPMAHFFMVSPEYLEVMRMPVLRGRGIVRDGSRRCAAGAHGERDVREDARFPARTPSAGGSSGTTTPGRSSASPATSATRRSAIAFDADVYVPRRQVVRANTWLLLKTDASRRLRSWPNCRSG